ncbi:hypothetical protein BS78_K200500 [Paspalum vaginatum]|uniref:Uncharacterized protein n=1 Tax=Paspalum vaginatum TaxID=158149 RepID=A0A9W7X7G6_9POAL|nr:hypothetical protein BS78_K200500 [Paspalum vaginatum]
MESMAQLKAIYFLRPSANNVKNLLKPRFIQIFDDSDEQEALCGKFRSSMLISVQLILTISLSTYKITNMYMLPTVVDPPGLQSFCDRAVDGIASVFLALKRRPVIRYQRTSDVAKRIAQETAVGQLSLQNISIEVPKLDDFQHKVSICCVHRSHLFRF